jgi:CMP-N-acetylneuraminic acid synthetase
MIVGIVAAKKNSNRFPDKNRYLYQGKPLFWHSIEPLLESKKVNKVYVATDSEYIKEYCETRGVGVIWRPNNAILDEESLLDVIKFAYHNLDRRYEIIVSIMANCPGHTAEDVDKAIDLLEKEKLNEIRSFNHEGDENGLHVFREVVILTKHEISSYIGCIINQAKEIHYKKDIENE